MRLLRHIRSFVLQRRGGQHYWRTLGPVVEKMTDAEQEALFRVLENAKEEGETEGRRQARTSPWRYGS